MSEYADLLPVAVEAVTKAAGLMRHQPPGALTAKGDRDMASDLDYSIERQVRAFLHDETPQIGFLGEEEGATNAADLRWILDPIDGTANFVRGLPLCAVSLALVHQDEAVLGVIELPFLGSRYSASKAAGAYADGRQIRASSTTDLKDAIIAIGDYAVGPDAEASNRLRLALTTQLAAAAQRVRMTGSAALDLAWLAEGRLDAALTLSNHAWDTAAGVVIAREAGALVLDHDGTDHNLRSTATFAVVPALTGAVLAVFEKAASAETQA
ncbi:inositol monophosphatase family protein [Micromonospora auratinigra]|uniref:inositol-phosphate phosphatase n=1 Tax=Micromonospora auratinigra TaxID=261654 RepID=A0A1A9A8J5_9ACTN|nr:inositol monophosphatase family protein [Micromonospora auratinigra]SBT52485.1 myo-inositol-1(or 4)-monophosphatase [Micromonospora auratinigra]